MQALDDAAPPAYRSCQLVLDSSALRFEKTVLPQVQNLCIIVLMANDVADPADATEGGAEFILSSEPIVRDERATAAPSPQGYDNLGELPRSYGGAFLFAIARDPHTLFVYWDIDWASVFGAISPVDRKVHLRVLWHEGIEESTAAVEPLAASHLVNVLHPRSSYRVEIGFFAPENVWNSVAISAAAITPPDDVAENGPVEVATIPIHLSFQRIVDTFRGSKYDGDALAAIVGHFQHHADSSEATLPESERQLLRALELGLPETQASEQRVRLRNAPDSFAARERVESILGAGVSSPVR